MPNATAARAAVIDTAASASGGPASPADLRFTGGPVADVLAGRMLRGVDVLVRDGRVAALAPAGSGEARETVDLRGRALLPAFIDAHVHIESTMLVPERFAELVAPHGTGTVVADPHEIANVLGEAGLDFMLAAAEDLPVDIRFMLPSCVPATPFEHAGAHLDASRLAPYYAHPRVIGLGEVMNIPGILAQDPDLMAKIADARGRGLPVDGHAPGISAAERAAAAAAGISTDHECSTLEEMRSSLALGMKVIIREGSAAKNLRTLIRGVTAENAAQCMFCSDDVNPADIERLGHMEKHLRMAVEAGLDPMTALRMATLHPAAHYGLDAGAVAPGRRADFAVVDDLAGFRVAQTWHAGRLVAEDGRLCVAVRSPRAPEAVLGRVRTGDIGPGRLRLPVPSGRARIIGIVAHEIVTKASAARISLDDEGCFDPARNPGLVKVAVIERHRALDAAGVGILSGYLRPGGLMPGAVAATIAHDSHNIVCAGGRDADMLLAVRTLERLGGGMVVVQDGRVAAQLPLPCAGLMSFDAAPVVARRLAALQASVRARFPIAEGVEPVMTLAFLALPVIPELRITDLGLFDVRASKFVGADAGC